MDLPVFRLNWFRNRSGLNPDLVKCKYLTFSLKDGFAA